MVKSLSHGGGAVVASAKDRRQDEPAAQARPILEGPSHELCLALKGEATRRGDGFAPETSSRRMFIPYRATCDPTMALVICTAQGLIVSKLDLMDDATVAALYHTTLPINLRDN